MEVLFPKINHLFGTLFMIRPYYASKSSAEMMHAMALKTTSVTTV